MRCSDADSNVLVCLAPDPALLAHLPILNPERDLSLWKKEGFKGTCHWGRLDELPRYGKDVAVVGPGNREKLIVAGPSRDGIRVKFCSQSIQIRDHQGAN